MSSFVAVLDACVLIPASLRDTLLRAVEKDLYRMQWSDEILEEVRRNLFPKNSLEPFHIEAQSPDEFLIHLLDLDPNSMERILREKARDLRKRSKTIWQLLDTLAQHAPHFAALMRDYMNT